MSRPARYMVVLQKIPMERYASQLVPLVKRIFLKGLSILNGLLSTVRIFNH